MKMSICFVIPFGPLLRQKAFCCVFVLNIFFHWAFVCANAKGFPLSPRPQSRIESIPPGGCFFRERTRGAVARCVCVCFFLIGNTLLYVRFKMVFFGQKRCFKGLDLKMQIRFPRFKGVFDFWKTPKPCLVIFCLIHTVTYVESNWFKDAILVNWCSFACHEALLVCLFLFRQERLGDSLIVDRHEPWLSTRKIMCLILCRFLQCLHRLASSSFHFTEYLHDRLGDGRVTNDDVYLDRPRYGTSTGRLSCSNPNLQSLPSPDRVGVEGVQALAVGLGVWKVSCMGDMLKNLYLFSFIFYLFPVSS